MTVPFRILRLHWVLLLALAVAVAVGIVTPDQWRWPMRTAAGWDAGVALYLVITIIRLARTGSTDGIRRRAAALDDAG
ncbi:hypothetical protein [Brevundimonas sp.]|jgi:uncharacterized membrane protein|uniref:hypothetical protein n=1 Tax=Brevundimonas sp. TaxID=1871086 RepID=UPI003783EC10